MTAEEFREKLPDYLAGELSKSEESRVGAYLDANPAEKRLADELLAAQHAVRQTAPSRVEAEERVAEVPPLETLTGRGARTGSERTAGLRLRSVAVALRYAAVIALAFAGGYATRGWRAGEATGARVEPEERRLVEGPLVGPLSPHLAERLERAVREYPGGQTLTWALLSLAAR